MNIDNDLSDDGVSGFNLSDHPRNLEDEKQKDHVNDALIDELCYHWEDVVHSRQVQSDIHFAWGQGTV